MTRILVVDDEPQIRRALRVGLAAYSFEIDTVGTGEEALVSVAEGSCDLVLLDLGLPDIDGIEVIRRIRAFSAVPIIVLSVRESQSDKVGALDAGADDFVTKPFGMEEVMARIRAALRRADVESGPRPSSLRFGDLGIDLSKSLVERGGERIHLTPTEYRLLEAMVTNPGKLLTHGWLLQTVWGHGYSDESQYLRVYVRQLRKKLGDNASEPRMILTEPGVGYRWIAASD